MKKITINALILLAVSSLALVSCTKEPPLEPNAHFSTKLVDNKAYAGETFYIYLTSTQGEFYTLYPGNTEANTYDPNDPTKTGLNIQTNADSFAITSYNKQGNFPLTLIAASSGNWAEDYKSDMYTLDVNVIDRRSTFTSFSIDKVEGLFIPEDNTILFYAVKGTNLTAKKAKWLTGSAEAEVMVNDQLQETGKTVQDFSPLNPNDNEGRTVEYKVVAPDGNTTIYKVKYILTEPSSATDLFTLVSTTGASFTIDIDAGTIEILYYATSDLTNFNLLASASANAVVKVGTKEIQSKATSVNLVDNDVIKVIAQDGTEKDYQVTLTVVDVFTSFKFTQIDDGGLQDLYPVPTGTIKVTDKTININVSGYSPTTNNKLVATFEGIDHQTVKIGASNTTLVSGTTVYTYDASPVEIKLYDGSTLMDTYTLTITAGK